MKVLTDWYPVTIKPVREGLYLVRYVNDRSFQGCLRLWSYGFYLPNGQPMLHEHQVEWRGLAFDPEGEACSDVGKLREELAAARDAALEEAEAACYAIAHKPSNIVLGVALDCADAIRALKSKS